ncbi:hypothetical protein Verru16b_01532 [Lacunisphaera limnophila]|uniref:Uncharacterized protein n=1 Tax=Lacunisphaera limnophila TaxID=1838286 RepID=A0A1D8AUC5_9BACT|nr:hypothetical protein [Lacunisphaera limnophila]AOS44470.1 hypothetical protein Verru16b_01532 [Lacunisphaera limnophila]
MAASTYSVTLHHLAPGATAAGLEYPDTALAEVTPTQLAGLLLELELLAAKLTIYEPSTPEIRIKTDREVFVVRTRYRQLCFVGREALLRGEQHSIPFILGTITGNAPEPVRPADTPRVFERPPTATPTTEHTAPQGPWLKITVLLVLIVACLGTGVWLLVRPARTLAPKFTYMNGSESSALLTRLAGEYQTGTGEGDRRLIIAADGTLRLAKYGATQSVAEEIIRTARGARQGGQPALATSDPYILLVRDPDGVFLFGQNYKRVSP